MTYRFAICDDEAAGRDILEQLAAKWARANGFAADISCYPSAEAFLFRYADGGECDILLLDIEMGGMSGVDLAKKVRAGNKEVQIIFVTGYMEYIADGYDVEALHYLIKPVTEEKLFAVLGRAVEKLRRNGRALLLDLGSESVRVPLYEIRFFEVRRNYVTVHAKNEYTVKSSLGELGKDLDDGFFRVGRSFLVNLKYISRVTKTELFLSDGAAVPLPRGLYDAVNRAMIEHL